MKTFAYSVCYFLVAIGGSVEAWVLFATTAAGKTAAAKTTRSPTPPDKRRHEPMSSPVAMVATTAENKVTLPTTNHQPRVAVAARAATTRTARAALPTRTAESSSSSAANNSNNSNGKHWLQNLLKKVIASLSLSSSSFSSLLAVETNNETNELVVSVPLVTQGVWTAYLDITGTGLVYYYNDRTGASQWNVPTTTFPVVPSLPSKLKCIARAQKRATLLRMQLLNDDRAQRPVQQPAFFATPQPADDDDDDETMYTDSLADMLAPYGGGSSKTSTTTKKKMLRTTDPGVLTSHGDWDAYRDDGTGYVYYYNRNTKITQWQAPSQHFLKINHSNDDDDESIACRPLASRGDWTAYFDAHDTCRIYYSNRVTGASQWTKPTKDFPTVRMNPTKQKRIRLAQQQS